MALSYQPIGKLAKGSGKKCGEMEENLILPTNKT